jgi:hypothetical protein
LAVDGFLRIDAGAAARARKYRHGVTAGAKAFHDILAEKLIASKAVRWIEAR